jgi:outer membrane protein W
MKFFLNFKTAVAALSFAALATTADAQVSCLSRGNFSLGSRIGFSAASTDIEASGAARSGGNSSLQLNLTPSIGYFFIDNFNVGLGMDYLLLTSDDKSNSVGGTSKSSDSRTLFGPFMRYYIPMGDDQAFFIGGVSGFGRSNTEVSRGRDFL